MVRGFFAIIKEKQRYKSHFLSIKISFKSNKQRNHHKNTKNESFSDEAVVKYTGLLLNEVKKVRETLVQ